MSCIISPSGINKGAKGSVNTEWIFLLVCLFFLAAWRSPVKVTAEALLVRMLHIVRHHYYRHIQQHLLFYGRFSVSFSTEYQPDVSGVVHQLEGFLYQCEKSVFPDLQKDLELL